MQLVLGLLRKFSRPSVRKNNKKISIVSALELNIFSPLS